MIRPAFRKPAPQPAATRLAALAPLDARTLAAIDDAIAHGRTVAARREVFAEGQPITQPLLLASGWAARTRMLQDGRRQIIGFLLPGDLIGCYDHERPAALSAGLAVTEVSLCPLPSRDGSPGLAQACAVSRALEERQLLAHVTRLGRLNAEERTADLLLELLERCVLNGTASGGAFDLPLTQELLADALGLTPVHVNRTLQLMRRRGDLVWTGRQARIGDPGALAARIGRAPGPVSVPDY